MTHYKDLKFRKRKETSGIGGQIYEVNLCMWLLLEGVNNKKITDFCLASNMEEGADFDDAVFKYHYTDNYDVEKTKYIFLQAKHKENVDNKITMETLLSQAHKGEFILRKYLSSYFKIKNLFLQQENVHPVFNGNLEDCEFIIYTNAGFNTDKCEEHVIKKEFESDHVFNICTVSWKGYYYEVKATELIVKALEKSLDYEILVKELTQTVREKSLDMNKIIWNCYHSELKEKVLLRVDKEKGRFKQEFLEIHKDLVNSIFEEIKNNPKEKDAERFEKTVLESVENFSKCLAETIISLPKKFENVDVNTVQLPWPNRLYKEEDIKPFLNKLKLFVSQPNERFLDNILQEKVRAAYNLEPFDNAVFADVKEKILQWWRNDDSYLTKGNRLFQDSARVCFWFDVRPPSEIFTGREKEVQDLHEKIQRCQSKTTVLSQMTSITGLGGIGKTELARFYISQYSNDYQNNIIWINAENEQTLSEGFHRLAIDKLQLGVKLRNENRKTLKSIIDAVYKFFSGTKCLFIFDNAVNSKEFAQFLPIRILKPNEQKPYVLITSRDREWESGMAVMDLSILSTEDAVKMVKKGLNIVVDYVDNEIEELVTKLQCFPLSIRQAMSYIKYENEYRNYGISDYTNEFEKKTKQLLNSDKFQTITNDYVKTTFTTWKMSIRKIREEVNGFLAIEILYIMAYLAPDNIPRDLFLDSSRTKDRVMTAVRLLIKHSMINGEYQQSVLSIHRLVQEVIRIDLSDKNRQSRFMRKTYHVFKWSNPSIEDKIKYNYVNKKHILPQLEKFLSHIDNWTPQQPPQSRFKLLLMLKNWFHRKKLLKSRELKYRYYKQVFEWLNCGYHNYDPKRNLAILEKRLEYQKNYDPPCHNDIIYTIVTMAVCYQSMGEHLKEKQFLEDGVRMLKKYGPPESGKLIFPLLYLSDVYKFFGRGDDRLEVLMTALAINEKIENDDDERNSILLKLADTYEGFENIEESKKILELALAKKEETYGVDSIETTENLHRLVHIYEKLKDSENKKKLLERLVNIYKDYIDKYQRNDCEGLNATHIKSLAYTYGALEQYDKELEILQLFLKIEEKYYPDNHILVDTLEHLGNLYHRLKQHEMRLLTLYRIVKIEEKTFGNDSINLVDCLQNLADAYAYLGDTTNQIKLLTRTIEITERYYNPNNYNLIDSLMRLEFAYQMLEDHLKRKVVLERVLKIQEESCGPESYHVVNTLTLLSDVARHLGNLDDQKRYLERAVSISNERNDAESSESSSSSSNSSSNSSSMRTNSSLEWRCDAYKYFVNEKFQGKVLKELSVAKLPMVGNDYVLETCVTYGNGKKITTQIKSWEMDEEKDKEEKQGKDKEKEEQRSDTEEEELVTCKKKEQRKDKEGMKKRKDKEEKQRKDKEEKQRKDKEEEQGKDKEEEQGKDKEKEEQIKDKEEKQRKDKEEKQRKDKEEKQRKDKEEEKQRKDKEEEQRKDKEEELVKDKEKEEQTKDKEKKEEQSKDKEEEQRKYKEEEKQGKDKEQEEQSKDKEEEQRKGKEEEQRKYKEKQEKDKEQEEQRKDKEKEEQRTDKDEEEQRKGKEEEQREDKEEEEQEKDAI